FLRNKPFYKSGSYDFDGVTVFNLNYHLPFLLNIENKMPIELNIKSYDLIIAHMPSGIIWANKIAQKYNKPLICGIHNADITVLTKNLYKNYFATELRKALEYSHKIACRSNILQKKFLNILPQYKSKTFVAPSGIRPEYIISREINFSKPIRVLTCGQLIKRKNIDKVICAIKELPDFKLEVIGAGKEWRKLKRLGGKSVKFYGQIEKVDVIEKMQKSDIFILPSVNETFGMVYIESMASGCITVGTKNDGIDGIILDGKNGFLCNPTVEDIKTTLLKIKEWNDKGIKQASFLSSPTLEKINENANETVKNYTLENCAKNYLINLK
nr:glycosyltransferase family 4 protein [bacterium]